jgi:hypothetical protein
MTTLHSILVLIALAAIVVLLKAATRGPRPRGLHVSSPLRSRPVMTANEREAYARLRAAMPALLVLPQISLGSFIDPAHQRHRPLRNHYAQLTADFVVCDQTAIPLVVIEIDDRSHDHPKAKARDARKTAACEAAHVHIVRWPATPLPTPDAMRERLTALLTERPPTHA